MFHYMQQRKLPLLMYGELSFREEERLRRHIAKCNACQQELRELRRLGNLVSRHSPRAIGEQDLDEYRSRLLRAVTADGVVRQRVLSRPLLGDYVFQRPVIAVVGVLVLLFAGVLCGRYLIPFNGDARQSAGINADAGEIGVSNLRILANADRGGEIELVFDAIRPMHIRGTVDNPVVQRVIARAIVNGENPGVRLRAAASAVPSTAASGDREIKAALLLAMKSDPNDGVRKAALEALLRYSPDIEIRDGLLQVLLSDANPGLRVAAINSLISMTSRGYAPDESTRRSLEDHLSREQNLFVRTKTESLLKGRFQ